MTNWLRKLFTRKTETPLTLPPRRELVQWFPVCNMWVPMSVQFWIDKGYSRNVARELYVEGMALANELMVKGEPRDGNGMYGYKGKDHGTAKPRTNNTRATDDEPEDGFSLGRSTQEILAAGEAVCNHDADSSERNTDTTGFTGLGGTFGGGGASGGWDSGPSPEPVVASSPSAPDPSPSYDAGPSIDTSVSDTSSSFDSSSNC